MPEGPGKSDCANIALSRPPSKPQFPPSVTGSWSGSEGQGLPEEQAFNRVSAKVGMAGWNGPDRWGGTGEEGADHGGRLKPGRVTSLSDPFSAK
jgi:hypothetical protein